MEPAAVLVCFGGAFGRSDAAYQLSGSQLVLGPRALWVKPDLASRGHVPLAATGTGAAAADYRTRLSRAASENSHRQGPSLKPLMIEGSMTRGIGGTVLAFTAALLASACGPVYLSDTNASATPRPASFDMGALASEPVATLGLVAPANLQGFSPTVSLALASALAEVSPPIRGISTFETVNRLTDQGLAAEYADLLSGFVRTGILERQRLRRIGSGLGARYAMLPGLAQLDETVIDKFEAAGLKLLRNRVTTLRMWLQLWDAQSGHILWESAGEVTVSTVLLSPKQTVPLEEAVQKLLFNMIQDGLLRGKTKTENYFD